MESCPNITQTLVPDQAIDAWVQQGDCETARQMLDARSDHFVDADLYAVGKCFYYQTAFDKSRAIMQQLIANPAVSPGVRTKALFALGKIAAKSGQSDLAMQRYEYAFLQNTRDMDSLCQYARLAVAEGSPARSLDSIITYIRQSDAPSPLTFGCVADYARESRTLFDAARIADTSCRAMLQFEGFEAKAWTCLRDNADHMGYEIRHVLDAEQERFWLGRLRTEPQDMKSLMTLAEFYYGRGRYAHAASVFSVAAEMGSDELHQADILDRLARSFYLAGANDLAQAAWQRLKNIPGQDDRFVFSQSMIAMSELRYDDAKSILEKGGMAPGPFHRLASGAKIAAFLSTRDYSRVGKESAQAFAQALGWCDAHLKLYPDDETVLHSREYVNWRVKESEGKPLEMVTANTDKVIAFGRRWENPLAGIGLTYAALAYIHSGKGKAGDKRLAADAAADFDKGEALLMEVFARADTLIASSDVLDTYNLMEAWLSFGWSKYNRGDYETAAQVFAAALPDKVIPFDRTATDDFTQNFRNKFPRGKILPKQIVEASRGFGTSRDRLARRYFVDKTYDKAASLADLGAQVIEKGVKLESEAIRAAPVKFTFDFSRQVIDGDPDLIQHEELRFVMAGYRTYLQTFFPAVRTETMFNLAVARYWHAKILREWGESVPEKRSEAVAVYDVAKKRFHDVLSAAPDHAESYRFLEYIDLITGEFQKGLEHYRKAMALGTDQPGDAVRKMINGANEFITRFKTKDALVEASDAARLNDVMILRVELGITLAVFLSTSESVQEAQRYAEEVAATDDICDPAGRYREPLRLMRARVDALLTSVGDAERTRRARIHQKVLGKLDACLSAHRLPIADVVNLTPSGR